MSRRAHQAIAVLILLGGLACTRKPTEEVKPSADLATLERTRDALRDRLARTRAADSRIAQAPEADILIGMPTAFTTMLVQQVTSGFLDPVEIRLRDIKIHKESAVTAKTFLGGVRAGDYKLDVTLHEVRALLKPGAARMDMKGNRVALALPIALTEGQGRATVDFDWESRGVGGLVCEDFKLSQPVAGRVKPASYDVRGSFVLSVDEGSLVAKPQFPDLVVHVAVEPSEETWRSVDQAIKERSWKCEKALGSVDVPKLLKGILDKGFDVRVPKRVFKTIRLPVGLEQSVSVEGTPYALGVKLLDLRITPDILWYGANVAASSAATDANAPRRSLPLPKADRAQ